MGRWADAHGAGSKTSGSWAASHPKAAAPPPVPVNPFEEDSSFLGKIGTGIGDAISGVPGAVLKIGEEAGKIARLPTSVLDNVIFRRNKNQINSNDVPVLGFLERNLTLPEIMPEGGDRSLGTALERTGNTFPVTKSVGEGFGRTAAELDPRGGFANLRRNYGRDPVGSALNDAANIATIGTAGGSALAKGAEIADSARLAGTAEKLSSVAEAANKVATLPFKPYEMAAKLPSRLGANALERNIVAAAERTKPAAHDVVLEKFAPRAKTVQGEILRGKAVEHVGGEQIDKRRLAVEKTVSPVEHEALVAVAERTAPALAAVRAHDPAGFPQFVADRYQGSLSPEGANLAADLVEGKADPTVASRIADATQRGTEGPLGRQQRQADYIASHPEATGYQPNQAVLAKLDARASAVIDQASLKAEALRARADTAATFDVAAINAKFGGDPLKVNAEIGKLDERARTADKAAAKAERDVVRLTSAADRARSNAEYAVVNAPARLKPMIAEARAAEKHLVGVANDLRGRGLPEAARQAEAAAGELITTLHKAEAAGIDPEHFFHTKESTANKGARIARNEAAPRIIKAGSERLRKGDPVYNRGASGQAQGEKEVLVAAARRATAERIAAIPGVVEHLGRGALAEARTLEDARSLGYVPWSPGSLFDTQGRVKPLSDLEAAAGIEHTTMFMPEPLFDRFRNYFEPIRGQGLGVLTDVPNRAYYIARLQLSPAYVTGQVLGNFLGLGPASSSAPLTFWKNTYRQIQEWRKTGEFSPEVMDAPRVFQAGGQIAEQLRRREDVGLPGKTGTRRVTEFANNQIARLPNFRIARFLDNLSRAAFYMTELEKRGSKDAALEATLRGMGEFDKFSPFERDVVRRVMPMYAWHREITKIAFHLAEDHPLRVAWTLHLGNTVGQQDGPLPDFYKDTVGVGGLLVGTGQAFPFGEVGTEFKGPLVGAGKFLGPTPKLLWQNYTGESASTGKPFSRPYDPNNPNPAAPSLLKQIAGMIPQVDAFASITGRKDNARYSTGEEIQVQKPMTPAEREAYIAQWHRQHPGERVKFPKVTIPGNGGPLEGWSNLLGVPLYDRAAIEQQAADKVARDAAKTAPKAVLPRSKKRTSWAAAHGK